MAISATHRTSNDKISFRQETIVIKIEFPDWIFALRPLSPAVIQTFTPTVSAQDFFSSPEIGVCYYRLAESPRVATDSNKQNLKKIKLATPPQLYRKRVIYYVTAKKCNARQRSHFCGKLFYQGNLKKVYATLRYIPKQEFIITVKNMYKGN